MRRLIKYAFLLTVIAAIALVAYAYLGPFFGADFSPSRSEFRIPVTLHAD